ncbi:MAG: hypothetical protein ABIG89_00735 [Candidatus Woesearchaeota archaeon]
MQEHYLIEHLKKYAKFEIEQGYELSDIRDALIKYGYKKNLVNLVLKDFSHLRSSAKSAKSTLSKLSKHSKQDMNEEMYLYIQNMLIDYIKKQLKSGYSKNAVRNALLRSGHHADMVDKAMKLIRHGDVLDHDHPIKAIVPPVLISLFSMFLLLVFVLFISISTDQNMIKVIMSFMPAFFSIIITYIVVSSTKSALMVRVMPLLSAAIAVFTYVIMLNYTIVYAGTDMTVLLSLNAVSGFFLSGIVCVLSPKPK